MKILKGNLFDTQCGVIAHGVNCKGAFGSGVAGQIAKLYPQAREKYLEKHFQAGWKLGDVQYVTIDYYYDNNTKHFMPDFDCKTVVNMATQNTYGRTGVHVDYDAIKTCFSDLLNWCDTNKCDVAIPRIGAGLAGGDWSKIRNIIEEVNNLFPVVQIEVWEL